MSVPMILSDLERQNAWGPVFPADLHTYVRAVWLTTIKLCMLTPVG